MSKEAANIHDAFFKKALGDVALAGTFLREHLPADVVELLDPQPPERVEGSFVDEKLRVHHSDLLFRVRLRTGTDALAYVLMEHLCGAPHKCSYAKPPVMRRLYCEASAFALIGNEVALRDRGINTA